MKRVFCLVRALIVILCCTAAVRGDQYWIAYEGNDFPENDGWERHFYAPEPSVRRLVDGSLQLDSSASQWTYDAYQIERPLNPAVPGEVFVAEWRVGVSFLESPSGIGDTVFGVARDGGGTLAFYFLRDQIVSSREGWSIEVDPGVPHDYRITSTDMVNYDLQIDGQSARSGVWDLDSLNESFVAWGDTSQGGGILSVSEWDYVRFGVVPEPTSAAYALSALLFVWNRKGVQR